jgi:lysozyme
MDFLRDNDIREADRDLFGLLGTSYSGASLVRQTALVDMRFNLGPTRFRGFKNLIAAIMSDNWESAAANTEASEWERQVTQRVADIVYMLRNNELSETLATAIKVKPDGTPVT